MSDGKTEPIIVAGRALLDTTVQVDRVKSKARKEELERLLACYQLRFAASFSVVEFKATVIQECITIHNQLRRKGARFTRARDALLEKDHPQAKLRAHIFNNMITVLPRSSFDVTPEEDERMAEKGRLLLENQIPRLFHWFNKESVDAILREKLRCNRATEEPVKKGVAFTTNLPRCHRGTNKSCRVEELIRADGPAVVEGLRPSIGESDQLSRAVGVFQSVLDDPGRELSVEDCRRAGDCLLALEAYEYATHAVSSNKREWLPISELLGFEFVHITYPEEKTH